MKVTGADALSRESYRYFRGIKVLKVNQAMFANFIRFFYAGTREYFKSLIHMTVGLEFPQWLTYLTASFATLSRQEKTNKKRLRNHLDTLSLATELNVTHLLPAVKVDKSDIALAHFAARYASEN